MDLIARKSDIYYQISYFLHDDIVRSVLWASNVSETLYCYFSVRLWNVPDPSVMGCDESSGGSSTVCFFIFLF